MICGCLLLCSGQELLLSLAVEQEQVPLLVEVGVLVLAHLSLCFQLVAFLAPVSSQLSKPHTASCIRFLCLQIKNITQNSLSVK